MGKGSNGVQAKIPSGPMSVTTSLSAGSIIPTPSGRIFGARHKPGLGAETAAGTEVPDQDASILGGSKLSSAPRRPAMRRARGRSVFWGQDHLRRAHRAMLDSRSSDLLTLARVALEAAIRSDDDLRDLLPQAVVAKSSLPRRPDIVGPSGYVPRVP